MEKNLQQEIFERSKQNKELIALNLYDEDGFWCGYVLDFNDEAVCLKHFTKYGKPDGILTEKLANIESIEFDDEYIRSMQCIIDYHQQLDEEQLVVPKMENHEMWQYALLSNFQSEEDHTIEIETNEEDILIGFVHSLSTEEIILKLINENGEYNGMLLMKLENINHIRVDHLEGRKRLLLYKWRNQPL